MPPKVKVVRPSIGTSSPASFAKQFAYEVSQGRLDTHLDILWMAIDERIRTYTGQNRPTDEETQRKLSKVRKLRGMDFEPEVDHTYGIFGETYRGVVVRYHGEGKPYENGQRRARIEIVDAADSGKEVGSFNLIPMAALMELPEKSGESDDQTQIQKI